MIYHNSSRLEKPRSVLLADPIVNGRVFRRTSNVFTFPVFRWPNTLFEYIRRYAVAEEVFRRRFEQPSSKIIRVAFWNIFRDADLEWNTYNNTRITGTVCQQLIITSIIVKINRTLRYENEKRNLYISASSG